jgi:ribulose-phosphate 3-epimerase
VTLRIAGSLWSVPAESVRSTAAGLAESGLTVWHWDRADGTLGPAGGFSAETAREIAEATGIRSEAHLMLADPRDELDDWTAFAELVVVHVESPHWREAVDRVRDSGVRAGIAISPGSTVPDALAHDLAVLVMTVAPGNAGAGFHADRLPLLDGLAPHPLRGIDGSADLARGRTARSHGANWIVSGTALTSATDPRAWLEALAGDAAPSS